VAVAIGVVLAMPGLAAARHVFTFSAHSLQGKIVRRAEPPAGDVGDVLSSTMQLVNPRTKRKLGSMSYTVTMLSGTRARFVTHTSLGDGTIAAAAVVRLSSMTIVLPVTGGTGTFAGARGTLAFGPVSTRTNVYTLSLP